MGTTGAMFEIAADGEEMVIIGDGHALDVNVVAQRIGRIVDGAGSLTSAGVWTATAGGNPTTTVTQLTTLAGLLA
jgi:hypothetical protein